MDITALAAFLATPDGLAAVRALQERSLLGGAPPATHEAPAGPRPILDWEPRRGDDDVVTFERRQLLRCKPRSLSTKTEALRVCVFGESMAAGFPLAPAYSPSIALQDLLQESLRPTSARAVEVIDLAVVNMGPSAQLRVAEAAQQLAPDVFVLMGGNNWHYGLSVEQTASPTTRVQYANRLREGGAKALASTFRDELTARARVMVRTLVTAARTVGALAVVVIPPVNHAWERRGPLPWSGAQATTAWCQALARAEDALVHDDVDEALAAAATMTALEGSLTSVPARLAVRAHVAAGRFAQARAAAMAAVDAANWHNVSWALPQTPGFVADVMRAEAAALGCVCVDLDAVFAAHTGSPYVDFRMFFDHCHLSVEGTRVAMAAVARAITGLPVVVDTAPMPETLIVGSAWFQAAHWMSLFAPLPDPARLEAEVAVCLRRAVDADADMVDVLLDVLRLASAACPPTLHAAFPAAVRVPGVGAVLSSTRLNGAFFNAVQRVAREHVDAAVVDAIVDDVIAGHADVVRAGIDIAEARSGDWFWERTPVAAHDPHDRHGTPFLRAAWPTSRCSFITDGNDDVVIDLVARAAGGAGAVVVVVNDVAVGTLTLQPTWQRSKMTVDKALLARGVNRVCFRWPDLAVDEDAALAEAARLLEIGAEADLFPVFGEVFSCRVQTVSR